MGKTLTAEEMLAEAQVLSAAQLEYLRTSGYDPHERYGGCDGIADGYCFECACWRAGLLATIADLERQLAEAQDTMAALWALADHWRSNGSLGDRELMGKSVQAILSVLKEEATR